MWCGVHPALVRVESQNDPQKGGKMVDEYLHTDNQGIIIIEGHRNGLDRRSVRDRRGHLPLSARAPHDRRHQIFRRDPGERRVGAVLSMQDLLNEKLSSLVIGVFLCVLGICMMITGLTFLPIIGIYVGIAAMVVGAGFLGQSFRSRWPKP
jgi:hypothetical protein